MASLNMSIPHELEAGDALNKVQGLLQNVKKQYGDKVTNLREEWHGNTGIFSFNIMGYDISGRLMVKDKEVELDGNLPFAASLFKGKIKSLIEQEAQKVLR